MPQISVIINGKNYNVSCAAGNEVHLQNLADYVNGIIQHTMSSSKLSEQGAVAMTLLKMASDISQLTEDIRILQSEKHTQPQTKNLEQSAIDIQAENYYKKLQAEQERNNTLIAKEVEKLAKRIHSIAQTLE
jgi:cell division protein ZapA (FtsZ GTPase activity inhibitor)